MRRWIKATLRASVALFDVGFCCGAEVKKNSDTTILSGGGVDDATWFGIRRASTDDGRRNLYASRASEEAGVLTCTEVTEGSCPPATFPAIWSWYVSGLNGPPAHRLPCDASPTFRPAFVVTAWLCSWTRRTGCYRRLAVRKSAGRSWNCDFIRRWTRATGTVQ